MASLEDRFSHYLSPKEFREFNAPPSFTGIGVAVAPAKQGLRVAKVFDASPAARAAMRAGDEIVAVNGRKLAGVPAEKAIALIKGPPGTDVKLGVEQRRDGHTALNTLTLTRATINEPVVASLTKYGARQEARRGRAGDVQPRRARGSTRRGRARVAQRRAGIVLDLRANGGGLVEEARLIASTFVEKGTIVSTRGRTQPSETLTAEGDAIKPPFPMVVLVDANTASAAEIVTAALQDHHRAHRRRHAHVRQGRLPGGGAARPTAARSTSRSASTSPRTGATSAVAVSSRARASRPKSRCAMASTATTGSTSR